MARIGFGLGFLAIVAGAALAAYGSPYYMLDWGGTLLLSGLVASASGVMMLMLAAILQELRRIGDRFAAVTPAVAPPEAIPAAMARAEPVLEPEPAPQAPAAALAPSATPAADFTPSPAVASPAVTAPAAPPALSSAAAPVAAGGLATAAASILSSVTHPRREGAGEKADAIPGDVISGSARDAAEGRTGEAASAPRSAADPYIRVDEAVRALRTEAGQAEIRGPEAEPAADDLDGLRSELLSPPGADEPLDEPDSHLETSSHDDARSFDGGGSSALAAGHAPAGPHRSDDEADVDEADHDRPVAMPAGASAQAFGDDPSDEPAQAPAPPTSEEGVIAAYTVGDSSYTMFADGRIRADTPDGELTFADMDELKDHMARKRLGA